MEGGEIILKQGDWVWLFKVPANGSSIEDFFIRQKEAFKASPEQVLKKFIRYYDQHYFNAKEEINTFYPNGYKCQIRFENIQNSSNIAEVMYHTESHLHESIIEKLLDPDNEGFLEVYGEICSILIDYDQEKIFGYLDDQGNFLVIDKEFNQEKERF